MNRRRQRPLIGFLEERDLLPEDVIYFMTKNGGNDDITNNTSKEQWKLQRKNRRPTMGPCGTPQKQSKTKSSMIKV